MQEKNKNEFSSNFTNIICLNCHFSSSFVKMNFTIVNEFNSSNKKSLKIIVFLLMKINVFSWIYSDFS